jgi:hypothetical protein
VRSTANRPARLRYAGWNFESAQRPGAYNGAATEIGIEPTARHGADLGYIPVLVTDACGAGNEEAAKRSIESLKFAGDALITNTETICLVLRK